MSLGKTLAGCRTTCQNSSPHPGLPSLGKGSNGQKESTRDGHSRIHVQCSERSPAAHRRLWECGKPITERRWFVGQFPSRVEGTRSRPPRRNGQLDHRSRKRPPCRRCGQSHWPHPTVHPDRGVCGRWVTWEMVHVGAQCIAYLHRQSQRPPVLKKSAARPEQNRSDQKSSLSERRTAGTERVSKIFAEMLRR
jgi:hypothetical protein